MATPAFDVCVLGSANLDLVATTARLPGPGETVSGSAYAEYPGGKGLNQAVAAARLQPANDGYIVFPAKIQGDKGLIMPLGRSSNSADLHSGHDLSLVEGLSLRTIDLVPLCQKGANNQSQQGRRQIVSTK